MKCQKTQNKLKIGRAIFKKNINLGIVKSVLDQSLISKLQKQIWGFVSGSWISLKGRQFFKLLSETQIHLLWLSDNKYSNIILQIQNIKFSQLTQLSLCSHKINKAKNCLLSIESLFYIQMPFIKKILLHFNNIISCKSLRKINGNYLQELRLDGNKICEFESLTQMKMQQLQTLCIEYSSFNFIQGENLSWLGRLQPKQIKYLLINQIKRVNRQLIDFIKENKYTLDQIW